MSDNLPLFHFSDIELNAIKDDLERVLQSYPTHLWPPGDDDDVVFHDLIDRLHAANPACNSPALIAEMFRQLQSEGRFWWGTPRLGATPWPGQTEPFDEPDGGSLLAQAVMQYAPEDYDDFFYSPGENVAASTWITSKRCIQAWLAARRAAKEANNALPAPAAPVGPQTPQLETDDPTREDGGALKIVWSKPQTLAEWAKRFGISAGTMRKCFEDGTVRHRRFGNTALIQVVVDDIPAP